MADPEIGILHDGAEENSPGYPTINLFQGPRAGTFRPVSGQSTQSLAEDFVAEWGRKFRARQTIAGCTAGLLGWGSGITIYGG